MEPPPAGGAASRAGGAAGAPRSIGGTRSGVERLDADGGARDACRGREAFLLRVVRAARGFARIVLLHRQPGLDGGAVAGLRADLQLALRGAHAKAHAGEAVRG